MFRRRTLGPIGAPVNPRAVMVDGRVVKIDLRREGRVDGVDVFRNVGTLTGTPRHVLVDVLPAGTAIRLKWQRD